MALIFADMRVGGVAQFAQLSGEVTASVSFSGVPSQEAFGSAVVSTNAVAQLVFAGVPSQEAFGNAAVSTDSSAQLLMIGIPSGEAFGVPTVQTAADLVSNVVFAGIPSAEAFGSLVVVTAGDPSDATPLTDLEMRELYNWVRELALINGLVPGYPVTVQKNRRSVAGVEQSITGSGSSTVVVGRV